MKLSIKRVYGSVTEYTDGMGRLHRVGGPAVEGPKFKAWYFEGLKHREGGPAAEYDMGISEWWYYGSYKGTTRQDWHKL